MHCQIAFCKWLKKASEQLQLSRLVRNRLVTVRLFRQFTKTRFPSTDIQWASSTPGLRRTHNWRRKFCQSTLNEARRPNPCAPPAPPV